MGCVVAVRVSRVRAVWLSRAGSSSAALKRMVEAHVEDASSRSLPQHCRSSGVQRIRTASCTQSERIAAVWQSVRSTLGRRCRQCFAKTQRRRLRRVRLRVLWCWGGCARSPVLGWGSLPRMICSASRRLRRQSPCSNCRAGLVTCLDSVHSHGADRAASPRAGRSDTFGVQRARAPVSR
jgi:hypothetical protein